MLSSLFSSLKFLFTIIPVELEPQQDEHQSSNLSLTIRIIQVCSGKETLFKFEGSLTDFFLVSRPTQTTNTNRVKIY